MRTKDKIIVAAVAGTLMSVAYDYQQSNEFKNQTSHSALTRATVNVGASGWPWLVKLGNIAGAAGNKIADWGNKVGDEGKVGLSDEDLSTHLSAPQPAPSSKHARIKASHMVTFPMGYHDKRVGLSSCDLTAGTSVPGHIVSRDVKTPSINWGDVNLSGVCAGYPSHMMVPNVTAAATSSAVASSPAPASAASAPVKPVDTRQKATPVRAFNI